MNLTITDVRALSGDSAFLLDDGETAVLYDTGFGFTGGRIAQNIQSILGERELNYILLTHSHYDHVLAVPHILKAYPHARVIAGEYACRILSGGGGKEEAYAYLKATFYTERIRPAYPIDAFNLNTSILIDLIQRELVQSGETSI